ncbi:MAG TPA: nitroreductase family deazaflavin-dependent oxidoreductase [Galbitalea sp.]|jgi:deazaflavin-dependent oxidoreductase (nitroreductase family)|nr:nitroreductase family deazaflavin-dependent oxidoreductase [Galbitalea sp.]
MTEQSREGWIPRAAGRILRTRWIVRAPIFLYKWRLGGIFGTRLLMLEHTGRKSGLARFAMVEIIDRPASGGLVIVSGFGEKAQWYRNVVANPRVRIYVGSRPPVDATARPLPSDEAAASLQNYAENFPKAWATLRPVLEDTLGTPISAEGTNLPMVLITPSQRSPVETA